MPQIDVKKEELEMEMALDVVKVSEVRKPGEECLKLQILFS